MRINKRFQTYIDDKNKWAKLFKQDVITFPLTQEDVEKLADGLSGELSPENLHCDGEISVTQARAKYKRLMNVVKDLTAYADKNNLSLPEIYY